MCTTAPTLYYDGDCGLCQGLVEFIQKRDAGGKIGLMPLQSSEFLKQIPDAEQLRLMDTAVLATPDGRLRIHSAAIIGILIRLGGGWKMCGWILWLVPRPIRDWGYKLVARHR